MIRQWRLHGGGLRHQRELFEEPRLSPRRAVFLWLAISVGFWLAICGVVFAISILDPHHTVPVAL